MVLRHALCRERLQLLSSHHSTTVSCIVCSSRCNQSRLCKKVAAHDFGAAIKKGSGVAAESGSPSTFKLLQCQHRKLSHNHPHDINKKTAKQALKRGGNSRNRRIDCKRHFGFSRNSWGTSSSVDIVVVFVRFVRSRSYGFASLGFW